MWQSAAENFFRRRALGGGIELNQQTILLWRDAFKADAVGIALTSSFFFIRLPAFFSFFSFFVLAII